MVIPILLFVFGLAFLIKGGDLFVDGATGIAKRFHIPEMLIGATVVSIGTTLPEVMVSATSALGGHGEIAYGNAIGSIICNTALVAAVTIAIRPTKIESESLKLPVIFFFTSAAVYSVIAYGFGEFSRWSGVVLLLIFTSYMILTVRKALGAPLEDEPSQIEPEDNKVVMNIIILVIGAIAIAFGADLLVDNGTIIATAIGVPESVIALTFIAIGTSLPELVTAITALAKGRGALSLGNVIGANIFNLVLVTGVSAIISPFSVPDNSQIAGINSSLLIDIPVMLFVMAFLTVPALVRKKLSRAQGVILILVYIAFCTTQFVVGF
jgi:cation:H+ antiporter